MDICFLEWTSNQHNNIVIHFEIVAFEVLPSTGDNFSKNRIWGFTQCYFMFNLSK